MSVSFAAQLLGNLAQRTTDYYVEMQDPKKRDARDSLEYVASRFNGEVNNIFVQLFLPYHGAPKPSREDCEFVASALHRAADTITAEGLPYEGARKHLRRTAHSILERSPA